MELKLQVFNFNVGGSSHYMGHRVMTNGVAGEYVWETYDQIYKRVINIGAGLAALGMKPDTNIGLFSINRPEWVIAEHGCYVQGLVTVPLYDTLGPDAIEYILNLTEAPAIFCTSDKLQKLFDLSAKIPSIKHIIVMDGSVAEHSGAASKAGVSVYSYADIEKLGSEHPVEKASISSETVATLCFTSGTTGLPKGVILTHGNLLSFVAGAQFMVDNKLSYQFNKGDVHISYLPLAHIFERVVQATLTYYGGAIGFYQGDTLKLLDDTEVLKPTIFVSVPRLYNKIYDKVNAQIHAKGGVAEFLFKMAYDSKASQLSHGQNTHWLWDNLVFKKIKAKLGGRVKVMITGAAPISKEVIDFLKIGFCCPVIEGYGQTENSASATVTLFQDPTSGHIGVPQPQVMIRLRDVPSMNYFSTDKPNPRGEICVKGASVFKGYYKAADKTGIRGLI
jgi:long-chain acyl-CoA synthetase